MARTPAWLAITVAIAARTATAEPKPALPAVVGVTEILRLAPATGFVDDGVGADDQHVAYAISDAADKCEVHVVALGAPQDTALDVSSVTLHPTALGLVGPRVAVVGDQPDGRQVAALVEPGAPSKPARVVYRVGPATQITFITRDGKSRLAVHRASTTKTGTRHDVELVATDSGRTLATGHAVELDGTGFDKQLDIHVNHWADGWTRAFGVKGGEWDPKEDQRSPDVEASYDLIAARFVDKQPITDPFEQRKRFQALAGAGNRLDFLRMTWDNTAVQRWRAGRPEPLELDQPIGNYDPKSLQGVVEPDGSAWVVLQIDPVNPDAVARQKADPEYLDIFRAGSDGKAARVARVLATQKHFRFGTIDRDRFWLLEKSSGSDRGGKSLVVYRLGG